MQPHRGDYVVEPALDTRQLLKLPVALVAAEPFGFLPVLVRPQRGEKQTPGGGWIELKLSITLASTRSLPAGVEELKIPAQVLIRYLCGAGAAILVLSLMLVLVLLSPDRDTLIRTMSIKEGMSVTYIKARLGEPDSFDANVEMKAVHEVPPEEAAKGGGLFAHFGEQGLPVTMYGPVVGERLSYGPYRITINSYQGVLRYRLSIEVYDGKVVSYIRTAP